jgi:hypothetical protein
VLLLIVASAARAQERSVPAFTIQWTSPSAKPSLEGYIELEKLLYAEGAGGLAWRYALVDEAHWKATQADLARVGVQTETAYTNLPAKTTYFRARLFSGSVRNGTETKVLEQMVRHELAHVRGKDEKGARAVE